MALRLICQCGKEMEDEGKNEKGNEVWICPDDDCRQIYTVKDAGRRCLRQDGHS